VGLGPISFCLSGLGYVWDVFKWFGLDELCESGLGYKWAVVFFFFFVLWVMGGWLLVLFLIGLGQVNMVGLIVGSGLPYSKQM
jgi:hypothetical protein